MGVLPAEGARGRRAPPGGAAALERVSPEDGPWLEVAGQRRAPARRGP